MNASQSTPAPKTQSNKSKLLPSALLLIVAVLLWVFRGKLHFDWATLGHELRHVSLPTVAVAVAALYVCYWLRAVRWAVLLAPIRKVPSLQLFPAQVIGFTIVAFFGRVADLARPWLIARRLKMPATTQLAIYSIERAFDLAAAAILFSITLAFAPRDMPHHEAFARAGIVSLGATLFLAGFALTLRFAGEKLASLTARLLRPLSPELATKAAERLLDFREGLRAVSTVGEFLSALALSLLMWIGIAFGYIASAHAFQDSPELAKLSLSATMLLLATSMGGSLLQLPIIGSFTQVAVLAAALHGFFLVPIETATACAAVIVFITTLAIAPLGLILARVNGIGLRAAAQSAEAEASAEPA
jgi:uncharacterized membrane protein YbhN (UPF0104 family)